MATCKDCLHFDSCIDDARKTLVGTPYVFDLANMKNDAEKKCRFFLSNKEYAKIPCYCKECKYSYKNYVGKTTLFYCSFEKEHGLDEFLKKVDAEHYCSYGERKCDK